MTNDKIPMTNQSSKSKSLNYWDLNDSFEICHLDLGF